MDGLYEHRMAMMNDITNGQEFFSYGNGTIQAGFQGSYSPFSGSSTSQDATIPSPMSVSQSPIHGTEFITLQNATVIGEPHITIIEQPIEKFRFRYKSEMIGTHGSLVGASSNSNRKKQAPTVQLCNYSEKAIIRCTLVTSEEGRRIPHAHRLVKREGNEDIDDPHHLDVSRETNFTASFHGMGIIHTAKKHIKDELVRKMKAEAIEIAKRRNINENLSIREEAQIKADADIYQKCVNLNSVALCFQAFILDGNNIKVPITDPVYSNSINNLKSALTGELKICRMDKYTGSCEGQEEVFIFVEKVGKKNIRIKFFEVNDDDQEIWCAYGRFSELDVHHQYAIAFRTPPYKDINITTPKKVFIQLERPTDLDCSEPMQFTYKPSDRIMGRKRQRISYSGSAELSQILSNYQNSSLEDILPLTNNDSRELSKEIKKILSQGCSPADLSTCIDEFDLEKYIELLGSDDSNMLTSDGSSNEQQYDDNTDFAKNALVEAICIRIHPAVRKQAIRRLLKERSSNGDTPLHAALRNGQRDIAKYILMLISTRSEYKVLVNEQNNLNKTPLHYAVLQNLPEIVRTLLMLGANPNICDEHGFSPLHTAVKNGEECVTSLLSVKSMNIEAYNEDGWTALHLAAGTGTLYAVRSLVEAGADVNRIDMSYGRTALHMAADAGHKDIVEFLLKETDIDVNKINFAGNTALHSAVVFTGMGAKELCGLLIQYGADPHIQNYDRESEAADNIATNTKDENPKAKAGTSNVHEKEIISERALGQTSFDLASYKPEILQLLGNNRSQEPEICEVLLAPIKTEPIETELPSDWLTSDVKRDLAVILDKNKAWEKLIKKLKLEYLIRTLGKTITSPSLFLLNYIDVQAFVSCDEMQTMLTEIGEEEAVNYLQQISNQSS